MIEQRSRKNKRRITELVFVVTVLSCISLAQTQSSSQGNLFDEKSLMKQMSPTGMMTGPALEGPINSDEYIVGPSDVFAVDIWAVAPLNLTLTVTPEGTLVIPTVGEIKIVGLSLTEAKKVCLERIESRYLHGQPTVTLIYPRQLVVKVTGDVVLPGRYVLSATNRVDDAIQVANKLPKTDEDRLKPELERVRETASTRNIRVTHRNGTSVRADIPEFYAAHKSHHNPYLLDGDEIFVPRLDGTRNVIGVYGGVNSPTRFEYAEGDNVLDAIQLAQGMTPRAITDSVTLTRFANNGTTLQDTILNYGAIVRETEQNVLLQPGDRIVVHEQYDPRGDFRATVEGEVLYPGTYPITRDRSHLSEVIRRAGGFTEFAALKDVQILRASATPEDLEREVILSSRGLVNPEDSTYLILESKLRLMHEVIDADVEALYANHDSSQDVILRSQDTVKVPSLRNVVYVYGQVVQPGGVAYEAGKSVDYYVAKAKGYTDYAKTGDVVVVKRTTRQWFPPSETKIEEGDYIWVPKDVEHNSLYWLTILGQSASILSVAISTVLLVIQLSK